MRTELHWIDGPWPGRMAILPRPRGGDWLADEVRSWRQAGVDAVVSLLTPDEAADLDLADEGDLCRAHGMEYLSFPIADRSVPSSRRETGEVARRLDALLREGKGIVIHCRQGIGRAALLAACLLVLSGSDVDQAFQRIGEARGCVVPETREQRDWVAAFAQDKLAALPGAQR